MKAGQLEPKSWEETMTKEEVQWLRREMAYIVNDPCKDNFRAARMWTSSQMRRFRKQESHGCCGSANKVVRNPNPIIPGKDMYIIGCNYGH